ncbi:MAG: hypothetical protein ACSHYB_09420 [Roseibacillus sp.]
MKDNSQELAKPAVSPVTVHRQSFQTGVFEFVPLPFVDDWLIVRERRLLVEKILKGRGVSFEKGVPKLLADGGKKTLMGRMGGLVKALVLKPLRKVLRTFLFWLAIRRAVLNVIETYFLARFVNLAEVDSDSGPITAAQAAAWGKLFMQVVAKSDQRFAREGTRRLWKLMKQKKKAQSERLSREEVEAELEKEAPGILADFDQRAREGLKAVSLLA